MLLQIHLCWMLVLELSKTIQRITESLILEIETDDFNIPVIRSGKMKYDVPKFLWN